MTIKSKIKLIVLMTEVKHRTAWNYPNNRVVSFVGFNVVAYRYFFFTQSIINFFQQHLLRSYKAVIIP